MKTLVSFLLFLSCLVYLQMHPTLGSSSSDLAKRGQEKLMDLLSRSAQYDGIIDITGNDFSKYIARGPRPYHTMIVLTSMKASNCEPCKQLDPEVKKLARIIESKRDPDSPDQIFIAQVDFIDNRETFSGLSLSTAPMVLVVPPTKKSKEIALKNFFKTLGPRKQYALQSGRDAKSIADWLSKATKIDIQIKGEVKLSENERKYLTIGVIVGIGLLVLNYFKGIRFMPLTYALACIVSYGFVIGGGMFNFIRKTPFAHSDNGRPVYISHQSRYQFAAESYGIMAVNTLGGLAAFFYFNKMRDGHERDPKTGEKIRRRWAKLPEWMCLTVVFICCYAILKVYTQKNGHYNMGHVPWTG